ncbi:hypothetical protein JCM10207_008993 [Rhodosporidiobolus poonsookiae]
MPSVTPAWEDVALKRREELASQLDSYGYSLPTVSTKATNVKTVSLEGVLSAEELAITESSVEELVDNLATGKLSSEAVTRAFCHRAVIAHQLTNCINHVFFEKALTRAKELDAEFAKTGKPTGPLHGLPVSLKNQVNVKDEPMDLDYVGWVGRISPHNAVLVDCLLQQGAVLYCLTNMPQALFSGESVNNLYGRTVNPVNTNLASGGSSGGEGALITMRGSVLGVGSDLGGSIRIPAAFNGLYGFRPSYNRIPYGQSTNSQEGQEAVPSVLGPLTTDISGLKLFFKSVIDAQPWNADPLALRMPWNEAAYQLADHGEGKGPLVFGMMRHNGVVRPNPPYERALEMAKKALEAQGHKVIDYVIPDAAEGSKLLVGIYLADGGVDVDTECATSGEPNLGGVLKGVKPEHLTTYQFWQHCYARRKYITKQLAAWQATKELTGTGRPIDAIITPPAPYVSFEHGHKQDIYYTGFCNLNDYPAIVLPVTTVDLAVDVQVPAYEYSSDFDKLCHERYDPALYADMPVALQVIAKKGEDEAVLKMAEIVDAALKAAK